VTFTGNVIENRHGKPAQTRSLYQGVAPGYAYIGMSTARLAEDQVFSVTRTNRRRKYICQYGFMNLGPDADPATAASLGRVVLCRE